VAGNWKKARQRINGELEALAKMAELAATQYATAEAEISRSCPVDAAPVPDSPDA
jgi:hypothetical protein